ncbi:MAG: hypothetical protein ACRDSF_29420, partial [Pseudonocardiaceae bacterium]
MDAQEAPVGGEADLPQGGQVGRPFMQPETAGTVDRGPTPEAGDHHQSCHIFQRNQLTGRNGVRPRGQNQWGVPPFLMMETEPQWGPAAGAGI